MREDGINDLQKQLEKKMWKNCKKALKEHATAFYPWYKGVYAPMKEVFLAKTAQSIAYTYHGKEAIGGRLALEDRHFFLEKDEGLLVGVLDGHNGVEVADYAANWFLEQFFCLLDQSGSVYETFVLCFQLIQQEIRVNHPSWEQIGSTAVISYLEKKTNYIYTATLGDSEANIYRVIHGRYRSIPLCCIRNWASKRDRASAKKVLGEALPYRKNPKDIRHPPPGESVHSGFGLNVSRALGDEAYKGVIHSPKITLTTLKPGDILILACDGLKDFVSEKEILEKITSSCDKNTLVNELVHYAVYSKKSTDNVTVVSVQVTSSLC